MALIALANQKGGTGKTTTTAHLARAAVVRGYRVLAVDTDPQANLTRTLAGKPLEPRQATLADVLIPRATHDLAEVLVAGTWTGLDLVPAATALADAADALVGMRLGRERRLAGALDQVATGYDLILIDCPPALGLLTINALTAADRVVVVSDAEPWSADGMAELAYTVDGVQTNFNAALSWAGVVVNEWSRTRRHVSVLTDIARHFAEAPILQPKIPRLTVLGETLDAGRGLDQWSTARADELAATYDGYLTKLLPGTEGA